MELLALTLLLGSVSQLAQAGDIETRPSSGSYLPTCPHVDGGSTEEPVTSPGPTEGPVTTHEEPERQLLVFLGKLKTLHHGVQGNVYSSDHHTIFIHDFHYDGPVGDAVIWAGESSSLEMDELMDTVVLSPDGKFYSFFDDEAPFLDAYNGETVMLTLPKRIKVEDLKFLKVWSTTGRRDLGYIAFQGTNTDPTVEQVIQVYPSPHPDIPRYFNQATCPYH